jgi:hypothetical protein
MTGTTFKLNFRDEAYGELSGIESAFRVSGETTSSLSKVIKGAGYKWHGRRACWYSYDRAARLILEDTVAVLNSSPSE